MIGRPLGRAAVVGLFVGAAATGRAWAYDFTIDVQTIGQGYQVRGYAPSGANELLSRRRLTQILNLGVFNIEPAGWHGDDADAAARNVVYVDASLRFDTDFGAYTLARPTGQDSIRELEQSQVDVLYAFVGGRRMGGAVDFQLGRQLHFDLVDFYAFDGGDALVRLHPYLAVEAFGGTEVRGELPLSSPMYELDGTSAGSRDPATRPDQNSELRPLAGAALVVAPDGGLPVTARLAYRRMWAATADRAPGEPDTGVDDEKLAATATAEWRRRVFLTAGVRYNLLLATFDDEQVALRVRATERQTFGAEMAYLAPTFDGDSIWNIFSSGAYRDLRASYELALPAGLKGYARGFARRFDADDGVALSGDLDVGRALGGRRQRRARVARRRAASCAVTATSTAARAAARRASICRRAGRRSAPPRARGSAHGLRVAVRPAVGHRHGGRVRRAGRGAHAARSGRALAPAGRGQLRHVLLEPVPGPRCPRGERLAMKGAGLSVAIVVGAAAGLGALAGWATAAPDGGARGWAGPDGGATAVGPPSIDGGARAVAIATAAAAPPSPLIFPAQVIPLRFDHASHLKLGARCETCHVTAPTSTSAADDLVPAEAACRSCHEIDRTQPAKVVPPGAPAARCDACHVDWMPSPGPGAEPPRVRVPAPNLKFNHRLHVARGVGCELCHGNVAMEALATRDDLPKMSLCLGCHDGKQSTSRCGACHLTEPDGRLKTTLATAATAALGPAGAGKLMPSGVLRGFDAHGPTFARDHAQAGRDEGYCLSCHKRSECVDCHGGTVRPLDIHPSDYVSLHGVDARRNTPDCSSCHRTQSFCIACHQRTGVAADATGGVPGVQAQNPFGTGTQEKTFHPPGWVHEDAAAGPSGHSRQARLNIRSCVSCHREGELPLRATRPIRRAGSASRRTGRPSGARRAVGRCRRATGGCA